MRPLCLTRHYTGRIRLWQELLLLLLLLPLHLGMEVKAVMMAAEVVEVVSAS